VGGNGHSTYDEESLALREQERFEAQRRKAELRGKPYAELTPDDSASPSITASTSAAPIKSREQASPSGRVPARSCSDRARAGAKT
jgi:hypothetical protein